MAKLLLEFIKKHISKRFIITGKVQRDEEWEYPLEAIREIIVNMIVHRDYRAAADSSVKIFDNRIEFINPGTLPENVDIKDILSGKIASQPRNKQIASIFKEIGMIEKYGSGIKRVCDIIRKSGAKKPAFEIIANCFKVTLFNIQDVDRRNGGVNGVLDFIKIHPACKTLEISDKLGIAQRTLERYLKDLREQQIIEFRGTPKTGGYFVKQ